MPIYHKTVPKKRGLTPGENLQNEASAGGGCDSARSKSAVIMGMRMGMVGALRQQEIPDRRKEESRFYGSRE